MTSYDGAKTIGSLMSLILVILVASGCVEDTTEVSGSVLGFAFEAVSGSAEVVGEDYILTLADTPEFTCLAVEPPPEIYLTLVVSDIREPGTLDADGTVFFNSFENDVGEAEAATRGSVTIDSITDLRIEGRIDATGPDSSVQGEFSVEVCQ